MSRAPEPRPAAEPERGAPGPSEAVEPGPIDAVEPLLLSRSVAEAIAREMESAYPSEGCGVLLGRADGGGRRVRAAVPSPNRWPGHATRYRVDPDLLRRLLEEEEAAAEDGGAASDRAVVGFYHSHPDAPPEPSPTDLEHAWPWYHYLIIPVRDGLAGRGRAWTLGNGRFHECPLLVNGRETDAPRRANEE